MSVMNWIQKGPKVRAAPTIPFIWAQGWHLKEWPSVSLSQLRTIFEPLKKMNIKRK